MITLMKRLDYGDSVRAYWNFRKKKFSIQKKLNGRWLVVAYSNSFMLKDATFKVSESGRQRVIKNKSKNVHAYIYGTLVESGMGISGDSKHNLPMKITYNPYKYNSFISTNLTIHTLKVKSAWCVKFGKEVTAAYVETEKYNEFK
jgi:hypothetical protein